MKKLIKIEVPKGYEIDKAKSTFELIVFKPLFEEKKWEDFGVIKGYYIGSSSDIAKHNHVNTFDSNRNTWPTKELAEATLALSQLCQWRDKIHNPYKNESVNVEPHWCIFPGGMIKGCNNENKRVMHFHYEVEAKQFAKDHKTLLETAKPLL